MKKYYCKELNCNNEICFHTWKYGQGRCNGCAKRRKRNPNFEKPLSEQHKNKLREIHTIYPQLHNEEFLIKEYLTKQKNTLQIAKELCCSKEIVRKQLIKFNIPRRQPAFKHGQTMQDHYCRNKCGRKITYQSFLYGEGNCKTCAQSIKMTGKMMGKNNPAYIHGQGYAPYPIEFNDALKTKIRKRDGYICQKCGMTEEEHLIVYGRVLDVHHIDYNKENCKETNLISLCGECNLRVNFNRQYWTNFFKEIINAI